MYNEDKKTKQDKIKEVTIEYKSKKQEFKDKIKKDKKSLEKELRLLLISMDKASYQQKILTNKGKLQLILDDEDAIITLKDRYVDAEVAKRLDYTIFMAVSERGGKDNSGRYIVLGEQEEGIYKIDQDLVNYELSMDELKKIDSLDESNFCIAEAFVKFANKNKLNFW